MSARLDIDALRALVAIETQGGVTRAADRLALSQSAVSHKIRRLEQALGRDLLARRAGGPLFTEAGQRLLSYARRMTDLHDEALAALGAARISGAIRLGMSEEAASGRIAAILGRFSRLYPEVRVRTRILQSLTLAERLEDGTLDAAVLQIFPSSLRAGDRVLYEESLDWVKSPDMTVEPGAPIPFVAFDEACFYKHWAERDGGANGHAFETVLECASGAGVASAVRSGIGVALLNGRHVDEGMERIEGVFPQPPRILHIARAARGRPAPPVAALIETIAGELGPAPARAA